MYALIISSCSAIVTRALRTGFVQLHDLAISPCVVLLHKLRVGDEIKKYRLLLISMLYSLSEISTVYNLRMLLYVRKHFQVVRVNDVRPFSPNNKGSEGVGLYGILHEITNSLVYQIIVAVVAIIVSCE